MGSLTVLKKFESLPSLDLLEGPTTTGHITNVQEAGIASEIFPFTVSDSIEICLESSTKMAASLEIMSFDIQGWLVANLRVMYTF